MLPVPANRSFERSNKLQDEIAPSGSWRCAHLLARLGSIPQFMAPVLARVRGCCVWDADGNEYIEYGMGLRSVTLGHGFRPVVEAVCSAIADGVNFSRPTELELAAAEDFLDLVPVQTW